MKRESSIYTSIQGLKEKNSDSSKSSAALFQILKAKHINPFPVKASVPFVKVSSKNRLSQKFCRPEVFVSKTLLQIGVRKM